MTETSHSHGDSERHEAALRALMDRHTPVVPGDADWANVMRRVPRARRCPRRNVGLIAGFAAVGAAIAVLFLVAPKTAPNHAAGSRATTYAAVPRTAVPVTAESLRETADILRRRIEAAAPGKVTVAVDDELGIVITSERGVSDRTIHDLVQPGELRVMPYEQNIVGAEQTPSNLLYELIHRDEGLQAGPRVLFRTTTPRRWVAGPDVNLEVLDTKLRLTDPAVASDYRAHPDRYEVVPLPNGTLLATKSLGLIDADGCGNDGAICVLLREDGGFDNAGIADAQVGSLDLDQPAVDVTLTADGTRAFETMSKHIVQASTRAGRLGSDSFGFAVIVDGRVLATPFIDPVRYPDGLTGLDGFQVATTADDARLLAAILASGPLPVELVPMN